MVPAQQQGCITVEGKVTERGTGEPLEGVNIFLANTTLGTVSDKDGKFSITNIPFGPYEVVFSLVGYETVDKSFRSYRQASFHYDISLEAKEVNLKGVTVIGTVPEEWRKDLKMFTAVFIGQTDNSSETRILNPEVLEFTRDPNTDVLKAYSDSLIKVENDALGYMLYITLDSLVYDARGEGLIYLFYARFTELPPSGKGQEEKWEENRRKTYLRSSRHFFYALVHHQLDRDNYSLITGSSVMGMSSGFSERINPDRLDVTTDVDSSIFTFRFSGVLGIKPFLGSSSYLDFHFPSISVDKYGNVLGFDFSVWTYGYWANLRIADLLPQNYIYKEK